MTARRSTLRQSAQPRATLAAGSRPGRGERARPPRPFAQQLAAALRIGLAPLAALAAALAGAVFVVLLPVCGIASLAEGFASACWRAARGSAADEPRGTLSHD